VSTGLDIEYLPDRNEHMGGTIQFADGAYQFPVELPAPQLKQLLANQAEANDDEIRGVPRPYTRIQREDCLYEVGYSPDRQTEAEHARFVAKFDRYGNDLEAYQDLDELIDQQGLDQYTDPGTDG
jgi:hypothetical protein